MTRRELANAFLERELRHALFDFRSQVCELWDYLRFPVFNEVLSVLGLAAALVQKVPSKRDHS